MNPKFNRDTFLKRLESVTAGKPYAWAAKHGVPKHVIASIHEGAYMPQRRNRNLIEEKTGISTQWLFFGEGPQWLPGRTPDDVRPSDVQELASTMAEPRPQYGIAPERANRAAEPRAAEGAASARSRPMEGEISEVTRRMVEAEGVDLELLEKIYHAMDTFFDELGTSPRLEYESRLAKFMYHRFLPHKDQITEAEVLVFLRTTWRAPRTTAA